MFLDESVTWRLTGHVQQFGQFPSEDVGAVDTVVHGDILDGDEGTNVQRSGPRMLTCTGNAHASGISSCVTLPACCRRARLTWVFAHVDEAEGLPGGVQRCLHHGCRGAHEGVDGPVGGGSGVDVQQAAASGAGDGCWDGIDHLKHQEKICSPSSVSPALFNSYTMF